VAAALGGLAEKDKLLCKGLSQNWKRGVFSGEMLELP